jgi:serine/threonine-protein phosphatase 2A regulatory subunit A
MVRRAAASKLGDFAKVQEEDYLKNDVVQMFEELAKDEQVSRLLHPSCVLPSRHIATKPPNLIKDSEPIAPNVLKDSVRLLAVEAGIAIVGLLREDAAKLAQVKPIVKDLVQDKSWRVRYMAAVKIVEVYQRWNQ